MPTEPETVALSRRRLLAAALAAGAVAPLPFAARGSADPGRPPLTATRPTLPRPTGPHPIGTVSLHLVDRTRPDPVAGPGRLREVMAGVWYPAARDARRGPVALWMPAAPWHALLDSAGFGGGGAAPPFTAAHVGAPVLRTRDRLPVILFSHGGNGCRAEATIIVQELASHGYVVVTVDSTFDTYSEFPDGRLTVPDEVHSYTPWDHCDDVRFVLDRVEDLDAGRNPDAGGRPLPAGLRGALDLRRVGMTGFSKGATATALMMNVDRRVLAGLSLDSPLQAQPPIDVIDRPFMLMTAEFTRATEDSAVDEVWTHHLRGWRLGLHTKGSVHTSYLDYQWLIPQLARIVGMPDTELPGWIGTLDPGRAVRIQQAYPLAFFDQHLRHRRQRLLEGPSPEFGEVRYTPDADPTA